MRFIFFLFVFILIAKGVYAQIDTVAIAKELDAIVLYRHHDEFWQEIRELDQEFRGSETIDSLDKINLVKASMYLNRFGYPRRLVMGKASSIMPIVWIHNSLPEADRISFPIIFEGYLANEISESELRNYYMRSVYKRSAVGEGYKNKEIGDLVKLLNLQIKRPIDIQQLLMAFVSGDKFLNQDFKVIGTWKRAYGFSPLQIVQDKEGVYYLWRKHEDGSHFPQLLHKQNTSDRFKLFPESKSFFEILKNGNLQVFTPEESLIYKVHKY